MKIATKYHGDVEISAEEILNFEKGIPGFPNEKEFTLLPLSDDDTFYVMQSVCNRQLAFVLTNPFHFFREYDFKVEDSVVEELELESEKDVVVHSILTVQDPFNKTTANLQAPVIINTKNRKAKQVILHNEQYSTKHPIFEKTNVKG
ncbi:MULTISPECIES: flagellar assembly protein FliW [unclassified Mesobacillus]|uniref:flagellar assembly protein FliW n=1 Tax=unclassified Mesobacillus TaxID=2675270 RepID=UPI00203E5C70|nr:MULTISPECIES: flagellar assembly protein FliW [unclassified Mesobacillus]MCM3124130.1 flagellar assembly protein FliW [Mesobacillus sp. MER 33]MCM3233979.1 flagellar assembly protein FliW [Mesobacillus sp. MER 48]